MRVHTVGILGLVAAVSVSAEGWSQSPPPAPPSAATPPTAPAPDPGSKPAPAPSGDAANLPPSLKLGLRASLVRTRLPMTPAVVIVPDARSYIAAIGHWNFDAGVRFPVLIDDGSWPSQQAIARLVRGYKPKSVVRWKAPEDAAAWPADAVARQKLLEGTAAKPWLAADVSADADVAEALKVRWAKLQFTPVGVVVASAADPSWPAALALAAGRGQPLVWMTAPGNPGGYMSIEDAAAFERRIEALAEGTGRSWAALGDDLDAVTICLNCSAKVFLGEKDQRGMFALTDWIGRKAAEGGMPGRERWAWAGQIIGSEWSSAYAAMSSLFLTTDSAWLFDGYESTMPWALFDATEAATVLEKVEIKTVVDDEMNRSITAWRRRAAGMPGATNGGMGVNAGLVMVNSSGNPDTFNLKPGEGKPDDAPILRRSAFVHFVHSWSASTPSDVHTVAGAWLERGAYAYVGSVHEPYLQAFVPTPKLAMRLAAGLPLGAAARLDDGEPWKISILGDPLITLGKGGPVVEKALGLAGAVNLQEDLAAALKGEGHGGARDYTKAITSLSLMGRDADASQLLSAVLRQDRDKLTPEAALAGLSSAYFAGDLDTFIAAYNVAQPKLASEELVRAGGLWDARDMLWHALWPSLGTLNREQAQLLSMNLRAETLVRDAGEAYSAVSAAVNPGAAGDVVARAARLAKGDAERKQIEQIGK